MWIDIVSLVLSLVVILVSCELFTNAIEWLGKLLKVGDGVVGSIFSAVGTCLPETTVPIIAILFSTGSADSVDIGIGAIMGAPFMLSTLAFFVTGASALLFWKQRKMGMAMNVNIKILSRDICFFIIVYSIGIAAAFIKVDLIRYSIALLLIAFYIFYIILTVRNDNVSHGELEPLHIVKFVNMKPNLAIVLLQLAIALSGIIFGAELFVENIERTSKLFGISALVLSLIVTPIATELPEKFNSIIWISKRKDTLALGNISGAMVFQSCIPVSIGILFTSWELDIKVIVCALLAIISALATFILMKLKGKLSPLHLITGGAFYVIFIGFLAMRGFR